MEARKTKLEIQRERLGLDAVASAASDDLPLPAPAGATRKGETLNWPTSGLTEAEKIAQAMGSAEALAEGDQELMLAADEQPGLVEAARATEIRMPPELQGSLWEHHARQIAQLTHEVAIERSQKAELQARYDRLKAAFDRMMGEVPLVTDVLTAKELLEKEMRRVDALAEKVGLGVTRHPMSAIAMQRVWLEGVKASDSNDTMAIASALAKLRDIKS